MKNVFLGLIALILISSCKKDNPELGELKVYVYSPQERGWRPDSKADVFLFKDKYQGKDVNYYSDPNGYIKINGSKDVKYDFAAKTTNEGIATISGVPYGDYIVVTYGWTNLDRKYDQIKIDSSNVILIRYLSGH